MGTGLILVGAGSARRMGGIDKVWELLGSEPIVSYALSRLRPHVDRCVLVLRKDQIERAQHALNSLDISVTAGGAERQDSVARGLASVGDVELVAIHDVARPFATARLLRAGFDLMDSYHGAVPALSIVDTLKRIDEAGTVIETVDRWSLRAVQTPQVFRAESLRRAHATREPTLLSTDDAQLLERAGFSVHVFPGEETNFKITTPKDLERAKWLIAHKGLGE